MSTPAHSTLPAGAAGLTVAAGGRGGGVELVCMELALFTPASGSRISTGDGAMQSCLGAEHCPGVELTASSLAENPCSFLPPDHNFSFSAFESKQH